MSEDRRFEIRRRAARLGITDLKAWCAERRVPYMQSSIIYAIDEAEADALFGARPRAGTKQDAQRVRMMALHSKAKHKDADRMALYCRVTGRKINSSRDLTPDDVDHVIEALTNGVRAHA